MAHPEEYICNEIPWHLKWVCWLSCIQHIVVFLSLTKTKAFPSYSIHSPAIPLCFTYMLPQLYWLLSLFHPFPPVCVGSRHTKWDRHWDGRGGRRNSERGHCLSWACFSGTGGRGSLLKLEIGPLWVTQSVSYSLAESKVPSWETLRLLHELDQIARLYITQHL